MVDSATSRWSLVIHRVTTNSVELWGGTLYPNLLMPDAARFRIVDEVTGAEVVRNISKDQWKRPFAMLNKRFFECRKVTGLAEGRAYRAYFDRKADDGTWVELRDARFETLPGRLPAKGSSRPFTIGLGSCFYNHADGGAAARAYKALYDTGPESTKAHIKFLTGDQVYLDVGFDSLSADRQELSERIAQDYAVQWEALGSILTRGGTWLLPDDHEYWNDYPFYDSLLPTLLALKDKKVREAWKAAAKDGVTNVQRSPVVEVLSFGDGVQRELSICLADLRSYRGLGTMMHDSVFPKLLSWARKLSSPGVLVVSQPLIVSNSPLERNLLSFLQDYQVLLEALAQSGHDIVVLSGDVHFGRVAETSLGNNGARLIEVVASPLSNLTGLSGVSTAKPQHRPIKFPAAGKLEGCPRSDVVYDKTFDVPWDKARPLRGYPRPRTKEHFMTVGFSRGSDHIEMSVQSWLVREPKGAKELPSPGFSKEYKAKLY